MLSNINLMCEYYQFIVKEAYILKTAFKTQYGHYEFLVISFGLNNTLVTLMDLMNRVFHSYLDLFIVIFIYGILMYTRTEDDHDAHLWIVLHIFQEKNLLLT